MFDYIKNALFNNAGNSKKTKEKIYLANVSLVNPRSDGYELQLASGNFRVAAPTGDDMMDFYISSPVLSLVNSIAKTESGKEINCSFSQDYVDFVNTMSLVASGFNLRKSGNKWQMAICGYYGHNRSCQIQTQREIGIQPYEYFPGLNGAPVFRCNGPFQSGKFYEVIEQTGNLIILKNESNINTAVFVNWGNPSNGLGNMLRFYEKEGIILERFCGDLIRPKLF